MSIPITDKFKPKGIGGYALIDAEDVEMPDGTRLSTWQPQTSGKVETPVLENAEISGFTGGTDGVYLIMDAPVSFGLVAGAMYKVVLPTGTYYCKCYTEAADTDGTTNMNGLFLGNASLAFSTLDDTGEPFFFADGGDTATVITNIAADPLSVSLYIVEEAPNLPAVTEADNDKILQVVDGAWAAVALTDVSEVGM